MKCDRRSALHRTERPRYAPAVRAIRLLARFRRPKVARSKYCSCEWNDGEHAGQARGRPARGMRMMPETPGMCTCAGGAHMPAADSGRAASAAYPFLRKRDATPHASRCAYPFLRSSSQKWVRSESRVYTLGSGLGRTRFCEPTGYPPYAFLRPIAVLLRKHRTHFCEAACPRGVPVSAVSLAETGTLALQASGASLWLIRVFTRRNRYGGLRGPSRTTLPCCPLREVSAMKVVKTEPPPYSGMLHRPCAASRVRRNGYAGVPPSSIEACTRSSANRKNMPPPKSPMRSSPQI